MTPAESEYLSRLASLSLSFVGFSAVVVTLRGALGGALSDRHLRLVRLYIEGGLLVTALALVPALLNLLHIPDRFICPLSSGAAASIFTLLLMVKIEAAGYPIILHAHDEILAHVRKGYGSLAHFQSLMMIDEPWLAGCPLSVSAFQDERYVK